MRQFLEYLSELSEGDLKRGFSRHGRNLPDRWFDRQGCHRVNSSGNYRPHTQALAIIADENDCACSYYGNTGSIRTPGTRLNWEDGVTLPIRLRPIRTCQRARRLSWDRGPAPKTSISQDAMPRDNQFAPVSMLLHKSEAPASAGASHSSERSLTAVGQDQLTCSAVIC